MRKAGSTTVVRAAAALLCALGASACAAAPQASQEPRTPPPTTAASATTSTMAPATTGVVAPVWTHTLIGSKPAPEMVTLAQFKGTGTWTQQATPLWVGCKGATGRLELDLGGDHSTLTGSFGIRAAVEDDLRIKVMVLADGRPASTITLSTAEPRGVPVSIDVAGVDTITVEATAQGGCTGTRGDILFLGDGAVTPRA